MDNSVIIAWTPTNWLTIFLMAAGGGLLVMIAAKVIKQIQANNSNA